MAGTPMVLRSEVDHSDDESFYELTDESDHGGMEDEEGVTHVYAKGKPKRRVKKSKASPAEVKRARAKQAEKDLADNDMVLRSEVADDDDESFYELTDESDHEGYEDEEGVTHVYVKGKRKRRVRKFLASAADVRQARAKQAKVDHTDMVLRSEVDDDDDESFYELTDESDHEGYEDEEGVTHVYVKGKRKRRVKKSAATAAEIRRAKAKQLKETKTRSPAKLRKTSGDGRVVKTSAKKTARATPFYKAVQESPNLRSAEDALRFASSIFRAADETEPEDKNYTRRDRNVQVTVFGAGGTRATPKKDADLARIRREIAAARAQEAREATTTTTTSSTSSNWFGVFRNYTPPAVTDTTETTLTIKSENYTYSMSPSYRKITGKSGVGRPNMGRISIRDL